MPRHPRTLVSALVAAAVAVATFVACVTAPETGRQQLVVVPEAYMVQMGADAYKQMRQTEKIDQNAALTKTVTEIGRQVARASGKDLDWEFTLFDSKDVNAFCLPGGKVGVYTGILPVAKTNAGLAAVLGHEIGHAVARHGAERATQALLVAGTFLTLDQAIKDPNRKQYILAALGLGAQVGLVLPFGRKQETEADDIGLNYMARAGYDPHEAIALWQRMSAASGQRPPEWLSTHPDPDRRIADLSQRLGVALAIYEKSAKQPTVALF